MKRILLVLLIAVLTTTGYSQKVFKRLPKPNSANYKVSKDLGIITKATPITMTSWRLTGPIAGFMYPQNQVVTGLGYGYQKLHWVDSVEKWYTDWSISGVVYAGGNTIPSTPNSIISVGVSLGVLNQLIMIGPAYNLPDISIPNSKGSIGIVFNVSMPLN